MAQGYQVSRSSAVFWSYLHDRNTVCSFKVYDHTLIYVQSGELEVVNGDETLKLHRGDCVFIRKDTRVKLNKYCLGDEPFRSVGFVFTRQYLFEYYKSLSRGQLPMNARRGEASVMLINNRPDLMGLFMSLLPYFDSDEEPKKEWTELKQKEGLLALLNTDENLYASLFDFADPWKIDLLDFMNKNYMFDLSMKEIAGYTGRSLSTLKRDFKKVSDLTPRKWILRKRLSVAHELLTTRQGASVNDVMFEVGFTSPSYFSRAYKNQYGTSPKASLTIVGRKNEPEP